MYATKNFFFKNRFSLPNFVNFLILVNMNKKLILEIKPSHEHLHTWSY